MLEKLLERYFASRAKIQPYMVLGGAGIGGLTGAFVSTADYDPSFIRTTSLTIVGSGLGGVGGYVSSILYPVVGIALPVYAYHKYTSNGQNRRSLQ